MAGRKAEELVTVKLPKKLPEGVRVIQCAKTYGKEKAGDHIKNVPTSFLGLDLTGEAIKNVVSMLSDVGPEVDGIPYGVAFVASAIESALVNNLATKLTPTNYKNSLTFLPPISRVRTIDPAAAAGNFVTDFIRENGQMPSEKDLAAFYADLSV